MEHLIYVGFEWAPPTMGGVGRQHFPARIAKGATVHYTPSEGIRNLNSSAVFKNPPRPNAAWLMVRWLASKEGQRVYAQDGRLPDHPKVEPTEKTKPAKIYPVGENEIDEFSKYEKLWNFSDQVTCWREA